MAVRKDYTVYEAVNKKRREIFVGVTRDPIFETINEMREAPHWTAGGWSAQDNIQVRSLEFGLTLKEAEALASEFVKAQAPKGWRRVG